jgi:hypothetical protein
MVAEATRKYNCHSFAWYQRDSSNIYQIDSNEYHKFHEGGGYVATSGVSSGNVAVYQMSGDAHSAVVQSVIPNNPVKYLSKWGEKCLFLHNLTDCPYWNSTSQVKYYKRG